MERLSAASSLSQNSSSKSKKSEKNKEIMIPETLEESLQNWKPPFFSASDVYKRSSIFNSCPIKTVEEEIPLSEGYSTFPLFSDNLRRVCPKKFSWLHIGMIQVALKPTKLGSNASAIIRVRDKSSRKSFDSEFGMVESSLCDGPIYFSYFPREKAHFVSLCDDLSSSLCIDIKTEGPSILMYRMHYRVLKRQGDKGTRGSSRYCADEKGETTLFLTNVAQSNRVWLKKTQWDEVAVPERWMDWKETAEAHVLKVGVPAGYTKEEVKVEVEDGSIVRISGERYRGQEKNKGFFFVQLGSSGKFLRRLRLPENAKSEQVKAAMEDRVLTLTVPKEEASEKAAEVKVIDISG